MLLPFTNEIYLGPEDFLYTKHLPTVLRAVLTPVMHRLRQWDVSSSVRVDTFIANSNHVADRIKKYYRRDAVVLNPPVDPKGDCTDYQKPEINSISLLEN